MADDRPIECATTSTGTWYRDPVTNMYYQLPHPPKMPREATNPLANLRASLARRPLGTSKRYVQYLDAEGTPEGKRCSCGTEYPARRRIPDPDCPVHYKEKK